MLPIRDNRVSTAAPVVTYTLIGLNVLIYLWDRQGNIFGPSIVFADLHMRPQLVVAALGGQDPFPLVTLFTSLFLHANIAHLLGNMLYLLVFGGGVEAGLGPWRFVLYYLFWGIMASATHTFVDPTSDVPTLGASGAIGGVLGAYFLLFPANKIELLIPFLPWTAVVHAWVLLGSWFLLQVFVKQPGVATWAHAGGFLAGMATVLIMGGREKVLRGKEAELADDFDD